MAKLSAHSQRELWRVQHPTSYLKYAGFDSGKVLKNYGSGWKVVKLKPGLDVVSVFKLFLDKGYREISR